MNNMKVQILEFGLAFCWPLLVEFITERAFVGSFWLSLSQKELLLALLVEFITKRAFVSPFWLSLSQKELLLALFG
jgi:hypothetical protein